MAKRKIPNSKIGERTRATHIQVFPSGAYLEFRKSLLGDGWASRAVTSAGRDNWIYFGPELPKGAHKI